MGDNATVKPFASVSVTDPDPSVQDRLAVLLTDASGHVADMKGVLSGAGLTKTGVGSYTLAATSPLVLTGELKQLVFTSTPNQVSVGQSVGTNFALAATDNQGSASGTSMVGLSANSINDAPTFKPQTLPASLGEGQTTGKL
jgi:hypothetical protein